MATGAAASDASSDTSGGLDEDGIADVSGETSSRPFGELSSKITVVGSAVVSSCWVEAGDDSIGADVEDCSLVEPASAPYGTSFESGCAIVVGDNSTEALEARESVDMVDSGAGGVETFGAAEEDAPSETIGVELTGNVVATDSCAAGPETDAVACACSRTGGRADVSCTWLSTGAILETDSTGALAVVSALDSLCPSTGADSVGAGDSVVGDTTDRAGLRVTSRALSATTTVSGTTTSGAFGAVSFEVAAIDDILISGC